MSVRNTIRQSLVNGDLNFIENMAQGGGNVYRTLSSLLYDDDILVRWRAIDGMGKASRIIAGTDIEKVRRQVRRILWLMNDESGGLCWNGPEAIAEIVFNVPSLIEEYGKILISFLAEEPFQAGTRRGIARIGQMEPGLFAESAKYLVFSLDDSDPVIRGLSIRALAAIGDSSAAAKIERMTGDNAVLEEYDFHTRRLIKITIDDLANHYLAKIEMRA